MRAIRYHEYGGPDVLAVDELDRPEPGRGEVLVEVRAASVNPIDAKLRSGTIGRVDFPEIPGSDLAGTVAAVGDGVTSFAVGDRVFGAGYGSDGRGTTAEYVVYPADWLALLPESVSFERGAAIALVGGTAWRALVDHADLAPADTCLVHGGSGGVGHVAVQLAALSGARVVATAGSEGRRARVSELGADAVFDYARDDLEDAIREAAPDDVDVVLDHRLDDYLALDVAVAATGCRIVTIAGSIPTVTDSAIRGKEIRIQGMGGSNKPDRAGTLRRLAALLDSGALDVDVARTYALEETDEAHRAVLEDSFVGKLVVTL